MQSLLANLQDVFARMAGEAGWDTSRALLWGYFFVDPHEEALAAVGHTLTGAGYTLVD